MAKGLNDRSIDLWPFSATLHSPALLLYIMAASLLLDALTTSIGLTNDVCRLSVARKLVRCAFSITHTMTKP